jgi:hypothetical protein
LVDISRRGHGLLLAEALPVAARAVVRSGESMVQGKP